MGIGDYNNDGFGATDNRGDWGSMGKKGKKIMRDRYKKYLPVLLIVAVVVLVYLPLLFGKTFLHTGLIYTDLWLFNYPLKVFYKEMLIRGELPFWTSLIGNGYPVFAEGQVGALYPFHLLLFRILPAISALNINILLHYVLGAVFTYMFSRDTVGLTKKASVLTAFCFVFSGYYVLHTHQVNIDIVVTYLPLVFLLTGRLVRKGLKYLLPLSAVFALQILAGHIEIFYYSTVASFAFAVLMLLFYQKETKSVYKNWIITLGGFGIALLLAAGVSFAQLYTSYELNLASQRSAGIEATEAAESKWPVRSLLLLINPRQMPIYELTENYDPQGVSESAVTEVYLYIGFFSFLLALTAIVFSRKRFSVVFTILLAASLIFGFGNSTQFFSLIWQVLPGLRFFRYPTKIAFFVQFCLVILAGVGFDWLFARLYQKVNNKKALYLGSFALLGIILADLLIFNVFGIRKLVDAKEWLAEPPAAKLLKEKYDLKNFRLYSHGTNNMDYKWGRDFEMQKVIRNLLARDFNMIYEIPNNREWAVLFIERQTGLNQGRTILDFENEQLLFPYELRKSLALQAVRYLTSDIPIKDESYKLVEKFDLPNASDHSFFLPAPGGGTQTVKIPSTGIYLYESDYYFPRAVFVTEYDVENDRFKSREKVLSEDFDPTKYVILEEEVDVLSGGKGKVNADVNIVEDAQTSIEISVDTDSDGFLVLADTFYPGWKAFVNGEETEVLRANYAFRAVVVKEGENNVKMVFEPTNWKLSSNVSLASSAVLLISLVIVFGAGLVKSKKKVNENVKKN